MPQSEIFEELANSKDCCDLEQEAILPREKQEVSSSCKTEASEGAFFFFQTNAGTIERRRDNAEI